MRGTKAVLALTLLALAPGHAFAQMGGGGPGGLGGPTSIDPGGDGGDEPQAREPQGPKPLQRKKYDEAVEKMFRVADTHHDGILTLDELEAQIKAQKEKLIRDRFASIDTDHNQSISYAEFYQWQASLGAAVFSDRSSAGRDPGLVAEQLPLALGNGRDDQMSARIIEPLSATLIVAANTNYDAGASLAEVLAYEGKRFEKADMNHDGWLTWDEIEQATNPGAVRMDGPPAGDTSQQHQSGREGGHHRHGGGMGGGGMGGGGMGGGGGF